MADEIRLNGAAVKGLSVPDSGRVTVRDADTPGLEIRVSHTGRKRWYYYRSHGGRPIRRALGEWPEMSASEARKRAAEVAAEFAGGQVDAVQRARRLGGVTLGKAWAAYLADSMARRKPRPVENDRALWRVSFERLESASAAQITRAKVAEIHREIGERHKPMANRCVQLLRRVWRWAERAEILGGDNPTAGLRMYPERPRSRFVYPEEAERFLAALAAPETPGYLRDFVELALSTGARKSSILAMRWEDLHGDSWHVRGATTKTGEALVLPLLPLALAALARRREAVPVSCPLVFPSLLDPTRPLHNPRDTWARLRQRAGLEDLTIHDLRRTLGSYMSMEGVSMTLVGRALGHKSQASTQVYAQVLTEPVRAAMGKGLDALLAAGGGAVEGAAGAAARAAWGKMGEAEREEFLKWVEGERAE